MKKSVKSLFLFALLFAVAGAFVVSCEKGGEDDPTGRYEGVAPGRSSAEGTIYNAM